MKVTERLEKLRKIMKDKGIDYYIIPSEDAHQSEYVCEHYRGRAYMSGFTGSAGTLLVGLENGILWTDGRYFIQALDELKGSGIEMFKMRIPGWPSLLEWLKENAKAGETIAFDGKVFSVGEYKDFKKLEEENNINIKIDEDLLDEVWKERPSLPKEKAFLHEVKYCGKSAREKLREVREEMKKLGANNYIIASLDDIAWLYNIRGNDVKCNPVVLSYALVKENEAYLYVDKSKFTSKMEEELLNEGVTLKSYEKIGEDISNLEGKILIDPNKISAYLYECIKDKNNIVEFGNITTKFKSIKNEVESDNLRKCQVRDGVAMVKFMKWLKDNIGKIEISEISASDKLEELRSLDKLFKGISFETIAGHKEHGAMMHYSATKESDYTLEPRGFLLIDSGGQYLDGTTDITRTFVLGELTEEERKDYTLVLKGHIGLMRAKFLKGTTGSALDIKAREPLWNEGIDYKCGTGHGVGFFLNVHEGPQSISPVPNKVALEPGMIITNEPGVYREGKHGIRTENTMVVVKDTYSEEFGEFYKFETISLCPIDLEGLDISLLNEEEKAWLNNYHKKVYDLLSPYLDEEEKEFLKNETREI
ncbi:aminopeptidase P family protein [Clostridium perfringens]|uniref:aminopeptidase P family protein n=1 Tax=Clostridium perfringens TaxID=1502 RepID=UPI001A185502|nr:aminopeptidase P family protein [Clostridium perfringens]MDH2337884.1 aminopeptidase P family protein [Clostridium perfringens]MDN4736670.1 aminopeptidase P family protein [Clostridium perfringens]MDN4740372.1 aminopeptidase P family protein [Clostridium perfringens]HAT4248742.1 aminopeptidase P family protein [Clostridium perfringens]HDI3015729.1 aminopeptidase P family protein [Clostridium perfringens]